MKIRIGTINKNEGEGRQVIYWDDSDKLLKSSDWKEGAEETEYRCETMKDAIETAYALWAWRGSNWDLDIEVVF